MKRENDSHAREISIQSRSGADVGSRSSRGRADRWEGWEDGRHWVTHKEVPRAACKGSSKTCTLLWSQDTGVLHAVMGHSPYGHPVRGSKAHTGAALSTDTQRPCDNTTQRLLGDVTALPHHLGHCTITFCTVTCADRTKDLQPNLPGRGRLPSLRLFPTQQPTKVGVARSGTAPAPAAATFPNLSPHPAGTPRPARGCDSHLHTPSPATPRASP